MTHSPTLRIGIDTGGTFTDIVCVDDSSGAMRVTKVSSTPQNPAIALVRGVRAILSEWGAGVGDLAVLAHGTTVATNALLQGEIEGLGLIVTEGFRHILEIARQAVPEGYGNSYFWVKPERIVPLHYVREAGGRLNFLGQELRPLDEASVRAAAKFFRQAGIHAVGVCLLHSYANPAHERRAAARPMGRGAPPPQNSSARRVFTRSVSASCTLTPIRRTSAAPPRSCVRNIPTARCRFPATCCPNIANTNAR